MFCPLAVIFYLIVLGFLSSGFCLVVYRVFFLYLLLPAVGDPDVFIQGRLYLAAVSKMMIQMFSYEVESI